MAVLLERRVVNLPWQGRVKFARAIGCFASLPDELVEAIVYQCCTWMHCFPALRFFNTLSFVALAELFSREWGTVFSIVDMLRNASELDVHRAALQEMRKSLGPRLMTVVLLMCEKPSGDLAANLIVRLAQVLGHPLLHEMYPALVKKIHAHVQTRKGVNKGLPPDADPWTKLYWQRTAAASRVWCVPVEELEILGFEAPWNGCAMRAIVY